jgi:hypothetical protein
MPKLRAAPKPAQVLPKLHKPAPVPPKQHKPAQVLLKSRKRARVLPRMPTLLKSCTTLKPLPLPL